MTPKNAKKSKPGTASGTLTDMVRRPPACRRQKAKSFCFCRIADSSRGRVTRHTAHLCKDVPTNSFRTGCPWRYLPRDDSAALDGLQYLPQVPEGRRVGGHRGRAARDFA